MTPPVPAFLEPVPVTIRVAQAVGITASAFMCGQTAAASFQLAPSLLEAPTAPLLARQWLKARNIGMKIALPTIAGSVALFSWLASREPQDSIPRKLYTAAAVLYFAKIPYSYVLLRPVDEELLAKADSLATTAFEDKAAEVGVAREQTTHALVDKWATVNLGRAVLGFAAALCGVWATLGRVDVIRYRL